VKVARFRIASIMVVVVIVALNLVAIRALLGFRSLLGELLILGALPMANVLAVGLLIGRRRPGNRPFLLGFVPFGAMALTVFVAMTCSFPRELAILLTSVTLYLVRTIGPGRLLLIVLAQAFALVVMMVLPQVVIALIGGLLSRKFMIISRISRRPDQTPT
jgi:hypothetical protein